MFKNSSFRTFKPMIKNSVLVNSVQQNVAGSHTQPLAIAFRLDVRLDVRLKFETDTFKCSQNPVVVAAYGESVQ